jgi:hypothetical protein
VVYKTLSEEYFMDAPTKTHTDPSGNDSATNVLLRSYSVWDMPFVSGEGTNFAYPRENCKFLDSGREASEG